MQCSLDEDGGERKEKGRWGGKRSIGTAFYIRPFISLLPSVIRNGRTPTPKRFVPFPLSPGLTGTRKNEKIKTALLQCPERSKRIIHAQRNLTALSRRQYQQKNILSFQIKMVFHQKKAISNLHLARPLIVMKHFLWILKSKNRSTESMQKVKVNSISRTNISSP